MRTVWMYTQGGNLSIANVSDTGNITRQWNGSSFLFDQFRAHVMVNQPLVSDEDIQRLENSRKPERIIAEILGLELETFSSGRIPGENTGSFTETKWCVNDIRYFNPDGNDGYRQDIYIRMSYKNETGRWETINVSSIDRNVVMKLIAFQPNLDISFAVLRILANEYSSYFPSYLERVVSRMENQEVRQDVLYVQYYINNEYVNAAPFIFTKEKYEGLRGSSFVRIDTDSMSDRIGGRQVKIDKVVEMWDKLRGLPVYPLLLRHISNNTVFDGGYKSADQRVTTLLEGYAAFERMSRVVEYKIPQSIENPDALVKTILQFMEHNAGYRVILSRSDLDLPKDDLTAIDDTTMEYEDDD